MRRRTKCYGRAVKREESLRLERLLAGDTPLRKLYLENLCLHSYSEGTIKRYYRAVLSFVAHF